jgi:hypothetical protein
LHVTAPDGLEEKEALRERWLQEMFEKAATDESGCMDEKTAINLIQKLSCSGEVTTVRIKQKLAVSNAKLAPSVNTFHLLMSCIPCIFAYIYIRLPKSTLHIIRITNFERPKTI